MDRDDLENLWGLGYANSRRLQFTESGLAAYKSAGWFLYRSCLFP